MDQETVREIRIDPIVPTQSVLISTARGKRPHPSEPSPPREMREYIDTCPFCRGNEHLTPPATFQTPLEGEWQIRIVENLYPIFGDDPLLPEPPPGMQQVWEGYGHHEVIIDHPNHGIVLHEMSRQHLALLFAVYRDRMQSLYNKDDRIKYILVFKNFGKAAGASISHTHSQLVAMPIIPHNVQDEVQCSRTFYQRTGTCIFCSLIDEAISFETTIYKHSLSKKRQNYETVNYVVKQGEEFIAIKPFASRYEWEVHILPIKHQRNFLEVTDEALDDLSRIISRTMARLNAVVGEVQYNYFLHTVPHGINRKDFANSYHWHIEICPRTTIPSGFELGSGLMVNTISPEKAAAKLRQALLIDNLNSTAK
jgi:UDPglucose--hexose-1-phosphate uridylyltransferase